jgi:hypothetical protein
MPRYRFFNRVAGVRIIDFCSSKTHSNFGEITMSKFEVGDRVKILSVGFASSADSHLKMLAFVGTTQTVAICFDGGCFLSGVMCEEIYWSFRDDWLEIVESTPETKETTATKSTLDIQVGGDHYKKLGRYQPWEVLKVWLTAEEYRGYMKGTAIAYLARERDKGGTLDIEKASHTLQGFLELTGEKNV